VGFSDFLNHSCDIYHMQKTDVSPGYGLPSSLTFAYPDEPDVKAVPCHFSVRSGSANVKQYDPQAKYEARLKLAVPFGTDIRVNDKIVDTGTGYEYTAEIPRNIRSHHTVVMVTRKTQQEPL
jgi:hypothetical protein